jgi:hypothetical protein
VALGNPKTTRTKSPKIKVTSGYDSIKGEGMQAMPSSVKEVGEFPILQGKLFKTGFKSFYSYDEFCTRSTERHKICFLAEVIFKFK